MDFSHHSQSEIEQLLMQFASLYPDLTRLYSIGRSVEGRDLWVMEVTDNPGVHEPGEPEFKYVSNMHGNEVTGREMLLHLLEYLCRNYTSVPEVRQLVDSTRIHLLFSMNPDGYAVASASQSAAMPAYSVTGRNNANHIDLNRNFPDRFGRSQGSVQPETQAIMDWLEQYPFVLSANFHNGALVANYPYDNSASGRNVYTATQDDDVFMQLALSYSMTHPTMHLGTACGDDFPNGITNGAEWYNVDGGMQDYNYLHSNCMEITVEQGCTKFPYASSLPDIWQDNLPPLLAYMWEVHTGVRGFVLDEAGQGIAEASVGVEGRDWQVSSAADGDYWRLLVEGEYVLTASACGYNSSSVPVSVAAGPPAVVVNFTLAECSECACGGGAGYPWQSPGVALALSSVAALVTVLLAPT